MSHFFVFLSPLIGPKGCNAGRRVIGDTVLPGDHLWVPQGLTDVLFGKS